MPMERAMTPPWCNMRSTLPVPGVCCCWFRKRRYHVSQTIGIPPSTRLIGFGNTQADLRARGIPLASTTRPKYMVWFSGRGGSTTQHARRTGSVGTGDFSDANPGTFYSGLSNIDFEIQEGNPAWSRSVHFAQHGIYISHVDFRIGSGYAAMDQIGNFADDAYRQGLRDRHGQHVCLVGSTRCWIRRSMASCIAAFKTLCFG